VSAACKTLPKTNKKPIAQEMNRTEETHPQKVMQSLRKRGSKIKPQIEARWKKWA
jgi:hypothetical protein